MEPETITVNRDDLKAIVAEQVATAKAEITEAVKQEQAVKQIPDLMREGFKNNVIKVNIQKDKESRLGMTLRALGKSVLENKSLENVYKEWGKEIRNYLPENLEKEIAFSKSLNMSSLSAGGAMVYEQYAAEFIDLLTDESVLRSAGVPIIDMPAGNLTFTKVTAGTTAYWRHETDNRTISQPTFGQVKLDIKTLCVQVPISDKLLRYGSLNVDAYVQKRIIEDIALGEDLTLLLTGTGTANTPKSLYNWTPAANQFTMTGTPTAATRLTDLLKLKKAIRTAKVKMTRPCWFISPAVRVDLESQVDANSNPMIYAKELLEKGTLFGIPVKETTALVDGGATFSTVLLVDLDQTILGQGMGITIKFKEGGSYYNGSATISGDVTGESIYTCEIDEDFTLAHDVAVARLASVTWGI